MHGRRTILLIFTVAMLAASRPVLAGPYEIRRSVDEASAVRSEAPLVTTSLAPFDDQSGLLSDGMNYFYMVDDAAGDPVQLSVHKNPGRDTVRLGFGDGDPSSADVDAARSSVTVSPATIPADGVTTAIIRVVPRDLAGVPLGAGLELTLDLGQLFPGFPAGPVVDHGNGSYTISVISWSAGLGDAVVTVERVTLVDEPQLTYEQAAPAGLPADLARIAEELEDLADASPSRVALELDKTAKDLYKALDELSKRPPDFDQTLFRILKALEDLQKADNEGLDDALAHDYRERLAQISRRIVVQAIHAAVVAGGDPDTIEQAQADLEDGDEKLAQQEFEAAVGKYMDAARQAEFAIP